jgi:predicted ATPase
MIRDISIRRFKSAEKVDISLGRVTVLIGENGSGKSNILEAIALLGAAAADKLDNEFLVNRGIRVTDAQLMLSAFQNGHGPAKRSGAVKLSATSDSKRTLSLDLSPLSDRWSAIVTPGRKFNVTVSQTEESEEEGKDAPTISTPEELLRLLPKPKVTTKDGEVSLSFGPVKAAKGVPKEVIERVKQVLLESVDAAFSQTVRTRAEKELHCSRFLIYAPENTALRRFEEEGQIQPVGIRGEGLFKMLQTFGTADQRERLKELKHSLELVGWFFDFSVPKDLAPGENRLCIYDRYLKPKMNFDQRSANEGFLFLIFYFAVLLSEATPPFFAIDNIDASLNPKLCAELMRRVCTLAKKYDKQIVVTTHNPAILDGLNLNDDEQRLYTVFRNSEGRTKVRQIQPPKPQPGKTPMKLSDAFLQGFIGGLPKNF